MSCGSAGCPVRGGGSGRTSGSRGSRSGGGGWAEGSVEQSLLNMVGRGFGGFNSTVPGTGRRGIF